MKLASKIAAAATLVLCLAACNKGKEPAVWATDDSQEIFRHLTDTWGFSAERIKETPEGFIVEGDQFFEKKGFWENYSESTAAEVSPFAEGHSGEATDRKHRRHNYKVTSTKKIEVSVKPNVTQAWYNALGQAVQEWNGLYGDLTFYLTYDATNTDKAGAINVRMYHLLPEETIAQGYFPTSDGKPGKYMYINPAYNNMTSSKKLFTAVHELGHTIGFRHTDTYEGSGVIHTDWEFCNYQADPYSVMRNVVDYWYDFSDCDAMAFYKLY